MMRSAKYLGIPQACGTENAGTAIRCGEYSCLTGQAGLETFLTQRVSACLSARQAYRMYESLNVGYNKKRFV